MAITAEQVKTLREKTGAGMMECKAALTESGGNMDEAVTVLRKRGLAQAAKRAGRNTSRDIRTVPKIWLLRMGNNNIITPEGNIGEFSVWYKPSAGICLFP